MHYVSLEKIRVTASEHRPPVAVDLKPIKLAPNHQFLILGRLNVKKIENVFPHASEQSILQLS